MGVGSPGWRATIRRSGTPTEFTDEPALLVSGLTYQIADPAKQVWDRETPVVVKDNGVEVDPGDIEFVDYLFGKVTFASGYTPTGPITVSGKYLPMLTVAGANSYTLNQTVDVLDDTDFEHAKSTGYRSRVAGLHDVSLTVSRWDDMTKHFFEAASNGEAVVAEVTPGGGTIRFRGFMLVETANRSGDVASLESEEVTLTLDGDGAGKAFSWDLATA